MTSEVVERNQPAVTALAAATEARSAPRRRRLWQLPAQAHELLLAMTFPPEVLRRETARALGKMHKGVCLLKGRDVDVLYSVVHDMVTRNPLSEAFQKRLDERHVLAVKRMAKLRDAETVQAAWATALEGDDMPGGLWALLTHPLGPALESAALYDARAWVFAHARRSVAADQAQAKVEARVDEARQQASDLRARLSAQQQQTADALSKVRAEIVRLNAELARLQRPTGDKALTPTTAHIVEPLVRAPMPKVRTSPPATPDLSVARPPPPSLRDSASEAPSRPISVHGRRVLCVGGIQHAVARYRGRIERLGGHFEHHDGGLEDSVQALEGRLSRAQVVICQAACINHEAYHRVKRHCERTGTPCVYLDRPSLSRLDRALAPPQGEPHGLR